MLLLKPYLLSCTPFDVWSHDALNVAFMIVMITIAWLVPLTTITGCYCKVTYKQKKKEKRNDNKFKEVEGLKRTSVKYGISWFNSNDREIENVEKYISYYCTTTIDWDWSTLSKYLLRSICPLTDIFCSNEQK